MTDGHLPFLTLMMKAIFGLWSHWSSTTCNLLSFYAIGGSANVETFDIDLSHEQYFVTIQVREFFTIHFKLKFTSSIFKKFQQKIKLPPVGIKSTAQTIIGLEICFLCKCEHQTCAKLEDL